MTNSNFGPSPINSSSPHEPAGGGGKPSPTVSLIVTTYNWERALRLYLESVLRQHRMPDELIIADDGSKEPTRRIVEEFARTAPLPVRHIWHEDVGFRLTVIRNKAIAAATGDYIIQTDGDLLLHPDFTADHLALAEPGYFVSGSRVLLGEAFSERLLAAGTAPHMPLWGREIHHAANGLRIPWIGRLLRNYRTDKVRGCNMAFWRRDLVAVNGYNEEMTGWGSEDCELAARLRNSGINKHTIKFGGIVYHLHHKEASRHRLTINQQLQRAAEEEGLIWCDKGLSQYL